MDEAHTRIAQVESTLATREQELVAFEAKYRKCVEKAKEVIKSFDPRVASGKSLTLENSLTVLLIMIIIFHSSGNKFAGQKFRCRIGTQSRDDSPGRKAYGDSFL